VPANPALFQEALGIIGSMLLEARIEKDTEREREIVFGEFNENYPFQEKLDWLMAQRRAIFKGHRLETYNRPIGRPEGFLSATEADLQGFYDEHYVPANISVVCVGGLSTKDVISVIERSPFGKEKNGKRNLIPPVFTKFVLPEVKETVVRASDYTSFKPTQVEYEASWTIPCSFPRHALRVFNAILWDVLFREIRQKRGLSYGFQNKHRSYQDVYEYFLAGKVSTSALSSIGGHVRDCISMVPSEHELFEKNLRKLIHRCKMVDVSGEDLSKECGEDLALYQRIISMQEVLDGLNNVKHEQMEEVVEFLSSEKQYTFMLCP
jgi:predicted Zn-dependent peptidase